MAKKLAETAGIAFGCAMAFTFLPLPFAAAMSLMGLGTFVKTVRDWSEKR